MPEVVNIHQAKTHLSRLLERVCEGEEIIIAKSGKPKAKLVALPGPARRSPGEFKSAIRFKRESFAPLSGKDLASWEGA